MLDSVARRVGKRVAFTTEVPEAPEVISTVVSVTTVVLVERKAERRAAITDSMKSAKWFARTPVSGVVVVVLLLVLLVLVEVSATTVVTVVTIPFNGAINGWTNGTNWIKRKKRMGDILCTPHVRRSYV